MSYHGCTIASTGRELRRWIEFGKRMALRSGKADRGACCLILQPAIRFHSIASISISADSTTVAWETQRREGDGVQREKEMKNKDLCVLDPPTD